MSLFLASGRSLYLFHQIIFLSHYMTDITFSLKIPGFSLIPCSRFQSHSFFLKKFNFSIVNSVILVPHVQWSDSTISDTISAHQSKCSLNSLHLCHPSPTHLPFGNPFCSFSHSHFIRNLKSKCILRS